MGVEEDGSHLCCALIITLITRCTHPQGLQVIINVNDRLHVVSNGGDDAVHHVNDAVSGVLVRFDETCAVHRHNLRSERESC